jgi:hypothetical protein
MPELCSKPLVNHVSHYMVLQEKRRKNPRSFETGIFNNMIDDYEHFHSTVVLHPDNQVAK